MGQQKEKKNVVSVSESTYSTDDEEDFSSSDQEREELVQSATQNGLIALIVGLVISVVVSVLLYCVCQAPDEKKVEAGMEREDEPVKIGGKDAVDKKRRWKQKNG